MRRVIAIAVFVFLLLPCAMADTTDVVAPEPPKKISMMDKIAAKGKFPRFCVNTVRWFQRTFNSFDTAYVVGHGKDFAIRPSVSMWYDTHYMKYDDGSRISMLSDPFVQIGIRGSFKFLSYTYNFRPTSRDKQGYSKQWSIGFTLNMLEANYHYHSNEVGTTIEKYQYNGEKVLGNEFLKGFKSTVHTAEVNYIFNHHKFSRAAATSMGRIQKRSAGSPFVGFRFALNEITMDYNALLDPEPKTPDPALIHTLEYYNYHATVGYAYNFVLGRGWMLGLSNGFSLGLSRGNSGNGFGSRFGFSDKLSFVLGWNRPKWFVNLNAEGVMSYYREQKSFLIQSYVIGMLAVGFRFSLW